MASAQVWAVVQARALEWGLARAQVSVSVFPLPPAHKKEQRGGSRCNLYKSYAYPTPYSYATPQILNSKLSAGAVSAHVHYALGVARTVGRSGAAGRPFIVGSRAAGRLIIVKLHGMPTDIIVPGGTPIGQG